MGGMIAVVILALLMVPVFFVVVLKSAEWIRTPRGPQARAHGRAGQSRHRARAAGLIQPHLLLNHGDPPSAVSQPADFMASSQPSPFR